jgi:methyl-accepting chemotaxis protein
MNLRRFSPTRSIAGKAQAIFSAVFLLVLLVLGLILYITQERSLMDRSRTELANASGLILDLVDIYVDKAIQNYLRATAEKGRDLAAYHYKLYKWGALDEEEAYLRAKTIILDPIFGRIGETGYLAGVSGDGVLAIHPVSEGVDASGEAFIQQAIDMKNGFLSYEWRNPGEEAAREKVGFLSYFEPWDLILWASSYRSEFKALLDLEDLAETLNSVSVGDGGYTFIMNLEGRLLAHPTLQGRNVIDIADDDGRRYVREMIEKRDGTMVVAGELGGGGSDRLAAFRYYPEMAWIIAAVAPVAPVYAHLSKIKYLILAAVVLGFVGTYLLVSWLFGRLMRPVGRIRQVAGAVSDGDLSQRIAVASEDEIGQIAGQFNGLMDNFAHILERIRAASAVLLTSVQNLSSSAQEISATSNQQAASIKEIVSTMEDSDKLAKSIANRINEVASISNNTKEAVTDGFDTIQKSLEKMDEIKSANAERIGGVRSLGERIDSIWEIVNIINGIADQTKIIAFNAELEASTAGDAGKNFKIVASEIRRLADGTVHSTGEIKAKINEIQQSSDHLILSSEEVTDKISEGWDLSHDLRKVFEDILSSSEISAKSADHIALSINQQVSTFEQILLTLKQISEGTDNFAASTRSMTEASGDLQETADGLNDLVSKYRSDGDGENGAEERETEATDGP